MTTITAKRTPPLRERMLQDLKLAGLSERTQQADVDAVRHLANHYAKSPDLLTEEHLHEYFVQQPTRAISVRGPRSSPCSNTHV